MYPSTSTAAAACMSVVLLLAAAPPLAAAQRMYGKNSPVLQVDAKSWDKLVLNSHLPSVVEFYAPWCGHCQNLKPAYEKAASSLSGIVQVAAVNCDEDGNKPLCGQLGIQGFPTIKTVRPAALNALASSSSSGNNDASTKKKAKKPRPSIVDYRGERSARAIADAAKALLPNLVTRLTDATADAWLAASPRAPKALLFSDKGTTSALLKSVALEFRGTGGGDGDGDDGDVAGLAVAQVRDREKDTVRRFGVDKFPTLVVLPGRAGGSAEGEEDGAATPSSPQMYDGELDKAGIVAFLSKFAEPVSSATAAAGTKEGKEGKAKPKPKDKSKVKPKSKPESKPEAAASATSRAPLDDEGDVSRLQLKPSPSPLAWLETRSELEKTCLGAETRTCILALMAQKKKPATESTTSSSPPLEDGVPVDEGLGVMASMTLEALSRLRSKLDIPLPFYAVGSEGTELLRGPLGLQALSVGGDAMPGLVAVNSKRGWYSRFDDGDLIASLEDRGASEKVFAEIERWVEDIKLGDFKKTKLPGDLLKPANPHNEL